MKRFTPEEDQILKDEYLNLSLNQLASKLGRAMGSVAVRLPRLGLIVPQDIIAKRLKDASKNLADSGKAHRFIKGQQAHNKGKKMKPEVYAKCKETMFKSGHIPATCVHFGKPYLHRRVRKDGYVEQIWFIQEDKNKRSAYLTYLCRQHDIDLTGKKPVLKPGFDHSRPPVIEDIEIVTNRENMLRNTLHRYPKELVSLIQTRSALTRQINKISKNEQSKF